MNAMANMINVCIGGEAGQGLVTVGELLARILVRSGYYIVVTQDYMSRIRGGHNTFAIRISTNPIAATVEPMDILMALNQETIDLHRSQLRPQGIIVANELHATGTDNLLRVPYAKLSADKFANIVSLGIIGALLGLNQETAAGVLDRTLGAKQPDLLNANRQAFAAGYEWALSRRTPGLQLLPPEKHGRRLIMNGNEAISLGALASGLKFCAFYPMTPSTTIPLTLIKHADATGVIVEQAEDEIAAINMAIGASFAGAPSMVATSGGGFALMTEGVSLAAMTETPVVIVVAQRPGPATGLPTRTEQADLDFVLHAGHGEFPRAIFAPGSVEECYHSARKAFQLAELAQGPVFILTDQFLADSYRAVEPLDLPESVPAADYRIASGDLPYQRFALTESGISPRLLPGKTPHLVVADSDEHTEDGHITEDLAVRNRMVAKRLRKNNLLTKETVAPEFHGDRKPERLIVSWGSTQGAAAEAATLLQAEGRKPATLHFSQVWPLVPDQFIHYLEEAAEVVCVEGNAFGQFARLIRRETGFRVHTRVPRYDGLPFTANYILKALK